MKADEIERLSNRLRYIGVSGEAGWQLPGKMPKSKEINVASFCSKCGAEFPAGAYACTACDRRCCGTPTVAVRQRNQSQCRSHSRSAPAAEPVASTRTARQQRRQDHPDYRRYLCRAGTFWGWGLRVLWSGASHTPSIWQVLGGPICHSDTGRHDHRELKPNIHIGRYSAPTFIRAPQPVREACE